MENKVYDCAIAGGGLAGLTLAIQLATAGYEVVLFEKNKYPFHRVCGEYISKESYDFLARLGVPFETLSIAHIDEVLISAPNGTFLQRPLDMGGIGISRFLLDDILYQLAVAAGAVVVQETTVENIDFEEKIFKIQTSQGNYQSKLAVGCYGKKSILEKKLTSQNTPLRSDYVGIKYHVKASLPSNRIELHNFANGYCGISKIEEEKYCMCYLTHASNLKNNQGNIQQMEENVLFKNPYLKKYFTESEFIYKQPLSISQVSFAVKNPVEKGVLLLGDAAGTIAPLCGNGMSLALHSSYIAYMFIVEFLEKYITLEMLQNQYEKAWHQQFATRIKIGAGLQNLFGKNVLTNVTIGLLRHLPKAVDFLVNLTHGKKY